MGTKVIIQLENTQLFIIELQIFLINAISARVKSILIIAIIAPNYIYYAIILRNSSHKDQEKIIAG